VRVQVPALEPEEEGYLPGQTPQAAGTGAAMQSSASSDGNQKPAGSTQQ